MAAAEIKKNTVKVMKEVEETVTQVVISVSPDEAAFISAAVGAVRISSGDDIGVDVRNVFSTLNDAVRASGARRLTSTSTTEVKVDRHGWPGW